MRSSHHLHLARGRGRIGGRYHLDLKDINVRKGKRSISVTWTPTSHDRRSRKYLMVACMTTRTRVDPATWDYQKQERNIQ